jgi:hypothetical protein
MKGLYFMVSTIATKVLYGVSPADDQTESGGRSNPAASTSLAELQTPLQIRQFLDNI